MSVSDPLIKSIKGCVQQFITITGNNAKISDNNFYFVLLGRTLENIFNQGLLTHQNTLYFTRIIDPYAWMVSVVKAKSDIVTFNYRSCVDAVKSYSNVVSNGARFRLLVKYCLTKRCLHVPVEFLVRTHRTHFFYISGSIIGDEILSEIFLSVLLQLSKIDFSFDLTNSSFLDRTWYIPDLVQLELVPCKCLGLSISFSGERAVIVDVASNSVAAENVHIKVGDILDKLNGVHITSGSKGRLNALLRSGKTKPINLTIAKAYNPVTKEFFIPIKTLLKDLGIDCDLVTRQYDECKEETSPKRNCYGYDLIYLGYVDVGSAGSVKQVEKALKSMLWSKDKENTFVAYGLTVNRVNRKVAVEIGEIGVKIRDVQTNEIVLDHSYMQISSCGGLPMWRRHFGYCGSNENCDISRHFNCFVFEAVSSAEADTILQSIVVTVYNDTKSYQTDMTTKGIKLDITTNLLLTTICPATFGITIVKGKITGYNDTISSIRC